MLPCASLIDSYRYFVIKCVEQRNSMEAIDPAILDRIIIATAVAVAVTILWSLLLTTSPQAPVRSPFNHLTMNRQIGSPISLTLNNYSRLGSIDDCVATIYY